MWRLVGVSDVFGMMHQYFGNIGSLYNKRTVARKKCQGGPMYTPLLLLWCETPRISTLCLYDVKEKMSNVMLTKKQLICTLCCRHVTCAESVSLPWVRLVPRQDVLFGDAPGHFTSIVGMRTLKSSQNDL